MTNILTKISAGIKVINLFKNWPQVFLSYFGLAKNGEVTYILRNGTKYKVASSRDWSIVFAIWTNNVWTPPGYEIRKGYIIVDIGAHVGIFSIFAASRASDITVFSYEPHLRNFGLLVENIRLNSLKNIKPFPMAVGKSAEKRKLFISQDDLAHSLVLSSGNYTEVECITLKQIIDQTNKCDFLKINCEGAEYEILLNAPRECLSKVGRISMDCHDIAGYSYKDLKLFLEKNGFDIKTVEPASKEHIYLYATNRNRTF